MILWTVVVPTKAHGCCSFNDCTTCLSSTSQLQRNCVSSKQGCEEGCRGLWCEKGINEQAYQNPLHIQPKRMEFTNKDFLYVLTIALVVWGVSIVLRQDRDEVDTLPNTTTAETVDEVDWIADLDAGDKDNLVAMVTQAKQHYAGLTDAAKQDIATKFQLAPQQVDEVVAWVNGAPVAKKQRTLPDTTTAESSAANVPIEDTLHSLSSTQITAVIASLITAVGLVAVGLTIEKLQSELIDRDHSGNISFSEACGSGSIFLLYFVLLNAFVFKFVHAYKVYELDGIRINDLRLPQIQTKTVGDRCKECKKVGQYFVFAMGVLAPVVIIMFVTQNKFFDVDNDGDNDSNDMFEIVDHDKDGELDPEEILAVLGFFGTGAIGLVALSEVILVGVFVYFFKVHLKRIRDSDDKRILAALRIGGRGAAFLEADSIQEAAHLSIDWRRELVFDLCPHPDTKALDYIGTGFCTVGELKQRGYVYAKYIAGGANGTIFKAKINSIGRSVRDVVIKIDENADNQAKEGRVLRAMWNDPESREYTVRYYGACGYDAHNNSNPAHDVKLFGWKPDGTFVQIQGKGLVMEYLPDGDLNDVLHKKRKLDG